MNDIIECEAALLSLRAERKELSEQIEATKAQRAALRRSDKAAAHDLLVKINRLTGQAKALTPQIVHFQNQFERKERHGIWETSVTALWGADGLAACRAQMRQEKMKREQS